MGEITSIIQKIHINKDEFKELVEKMDPLIKKYVRLLYKDNKEDVHSEMTLALWEAVIRMEYCESDGECPAFLCTALKNRFYELYRKSKKEHDNQQLIDNNDVFGISTESVDTTLSLAINPQISAVHIRQSPNPAG